MMMIFDDDDDDDDDDDVDDDDDDDDDLWTNAMNDVFSWRLEWLRHTYRGCMFV